jgi:hypothetical protein
VTRVMEVTEMEGRMVVASGWGREWIGHFCTVSNDEKILEMGWVMIAQQPLYWEPPNCTLKNLNWVAKARWKKWTPETQWPWSHSQDPDNKWGGQEWNPKAVTAPIFPWPLKKQVCGFGIPAESYNPTTRRGKKWLGFHFIVMKTVTKVS